MKGGLSRRGGRKLRKEEILKANRGGKTSVFKRKTDHSPYAVFTLNS